MIRKFLALIVMTIMVFGQSVTAEANDGTLYGGSSSLENYVLEQMRRREEEQRRRYEKLLAERFRQMEAEFNSLVAQGDKFYSNKNYSAAIDSYAKAKEIDSERLDEFYKNLVNNGDKLKAQGQALAALDYYKKAATMNLNDQKLIEKIGDISLEQYNLTGDYNDNLNFFETLNTVKPNDPLINAVLGTIYTHLKQYQKAITFLERVAKLVPSDSSVRIMLGGCHLMLKNYDIAVENLKKAIKLDPKNASAHFYLGNIYVQTKDYQSAKKCFKKAIKLNPNYAEAKDALQSISKIQ